jgi:alkanesulfonate monooxygenase SsuD/methylene tetrahydromethanopterin reductase-like flavin-dependent oxidoreductase (luciferase family)
MSSLAGRVPVAAAPFATGSVAVKPYLHDELPPVERVAELLHQAALADEAGYDGLVLPEHHAGVLPGYLPAPAAAVGWVLARTAGLWAAPCPTLLLLRPTLLVAAVLAWLAAAFPGRVGAAFAAGTPGAEFTLAGAPAGDLADRFGQELTRAARVLRGAGEAGPGGMLAGDAAVGLLAGHPLPLLSAASSLTACRRAARAGPGLLLDAEISPAVASQRISAYRAAGGAGPAVLTRKAWLGALPRDLIDRQQRAYLRRAREAGRPFQPRRAEETGLVWGDAASVTSGLCDQLTAAGADAVILQLHLPGISADAARGQVERIGAEVLPGLRGSFGAPSAWPATAATDGGNQ